MNTKPTNILIRSFLWLWKRTRTVVLLVGFLLTFILGYHFHSAMVSPPNGEAVSHNHESEDQAKSQVWTCSMHPQIRKPSPGKCPICGMDLIPADDAGAGMGSMRQLSVSPEAAELMRLQTSPAERRYAETTIRMAGKVEYDETRLAYITAWVNGRLDRLYVDYTGVPVKKGDHMVLLYSPELLTAQEELLQALRAVRELTNSGIGIVRETAQGTVVAAREKLRLWGLNKEQIQAIERRGSPTDHVTINSPSGGIVIHKNAQEGMYVQTGTRIYTIADLTRLWVKFDAYESDLAWLRYGQTVEFTTQAYPGETFTGKIAFIDPVLHDKRRTAKVRVNVPNDDGRLKPGMFARGLVRAKIARGGRVMEPSLAGKWISPMHPEIIKDGPGKCDICGMPLVKAEELGYVSPEAVGASKPLVVPASSVLVTGTRAIIYVKVPNAEKPTFEGREVVLGPRTGNYYIIRSNLEEGELVVTQGNFKIDSALQLSAKPSMMTPEGGGGGGGHQHGGHSTVAKGEATTQPATFSLDVPPLFREQWTGVEHALQKLTVAAADKHQDRIKESFRNFATSLKDVDMHQLSGAAYNMWMELSMKLSNDAVEGEHATDHAEVMALLGGLTTRIAKVRGHFGLQAAHAHGPTLIIPDDFGRSLEPALASYFELSRSLAGDNLKKSKAALKELHAALDQIELMPLARDAQMAWNTSKTNLDKSIASIGSASDIKTAREGFAPLSEELAHLTRTFGAGVITSIYRIKCPMAFKNRGATWLQNNRTVINPYFGEMMLRCGSVIETIAHKDAHEGHSHE